MTGDTLFLLARRPKLPSRGIPDIVALEKLAESLCSRSSVMLTVARSLSVSNMQVGVAENQ